MHFHITTIIITILQHINRIFTQGIPVSPCPKVFQYRFDGTDWFGLLSVRNPNPTEALHIKVTLSMRGKPATNYLGEIELLSRGQMNIDAPVLYKIKFPKTHFPPKLLQINANNRVVCVGQADQGIFLTQIQLEHTRKFTFIDAHDDDADDDDEPSGALLTAEDDMTFPAATLKTGGSGSGGGSGGVEHVNDGDDTAFVFPPTIIDAEFSVEHVPIAKVEIKPKKSKKQPALQDICGKIDRRLRTRKSSSGAQLTTSATKADNGGDDSLHTFHLANANVRRKASDSHSHSSDSELPAIPLRSADKPNIDSKSSTAQSRLPSQMSAALARGVWPWLAAVYVNNLTTLAYQCAGTLVSARVVISSAHCFRMQQQRYTANEVLVFLGRHNLRNWNEEKSVAAPVNDIFIHPDYDASMGTYDADIAVLVLKHQIRFNSYIRPACLWPSGNTQLENVIGERGFIVGWGLSHASSESQSSMASAMGSRPPTTTQAVPHLVSAPIVSHEMCFAANPQLYSLTSNRTFCAGSLLASVANPARNPLSLDAVAKRKEEAKAEAQIPISIGPCTGDSGAGLLLLRNKRWVLRGTVSAALPWPFGEKKCIQNQYVIYADVAKFLDWIMAFIL